MEHATRLANLYRLVIEREDQTFAIAVAELPDVRTRAARVDAAVEAVRASTVVALRPLIDDGIAPTPVREMEGAIGAWVSEIELLPGGEPAAADVEKPSPAALRAISQWTAERYRIVLEQAADGAFVAAGVELPEIIAQGATPGAAVDEATRRLAEAAYALLDAGRVPPEPLRDVEARRVVAPKPRAWARVA
jgi:predicted RNase H-like HicB family nuclease